MKWMLTYVVAGGLGLMAWQILDVPDDPMAELSVRRTYDVQYVNVEWDGNTARRDEILTSAVWPSPNRH